MTIAIYGATGFIGKEFLNGSKHKCISIPRGTRVTNAEEILFCIGTTDNYNVFSNPTLDIETNLNELVSTLEEIRNSGRKPIFNYVSTWFVYGDGDIPYKESQNCNPKGFYSITKYSAELLLKSYCETFEIEYRIFRLANVVGKSDSGVSKKKNALQFLLEQLRNNETVELYENGNIIRDFIHVKDLVRAIDLLLLTGPTNTIINIGSGLPKRMIDLISHAKEILKSKSELKSIATPNFHKLVQVKDSYLDVTILKSLGFNIEYPLEKVLTNL